jgi:hypothetical protein
MPLWVVVIPATVAIVVLGVVASIGQTVKDRRASRREAPHR